MVIPKGCPRCHGDLAYVDDVGDAYHSCVQCGFVKYEQAAAAPRVLHEVIAERPRPVAVTRDEVHRRRLQRRLAERQRTSVA
ncbi:MAG: hypothetical protein AB7G21_11085 [Dehalococcoidia bacterium]